jgi:beta-lactamase superfamily II metal-dependent hydrolase
MKLPSNYLAILDVGHGNCCLVNDGGEVSVIDCGAGEWLLQFLIDQKISHIRYVLLSHSDQDHIWGLMILLTSGIAKIDRVYLNTDSAKQSKLWKTLIYELESQELKGLLKWDVQLTAGHDASEFVVGAVCVELLAPSKAIAALGPGSRTKDGMQITSNSISAVVRLSKNGNPVALLPGDIDTVGLSDLKRRTSTPSFPTPILIWPHHGGKSGAADNDQVDLVGFSNEVCDLFCPRIVVFSIGRNRYGTPRPEILGVLTSKIANLRIACTQLSNQCSVSLPENEPSHILPIHGAGREERMCCAGTMIVDFDAIPDLLPSWKEHRSFVSNYVNDALCHSD